MKIIAIIGSFRKKGNTARIVQMIAEQLTVTAASVGQAVEFESVYLGDAQLQFCRGCRVCFDKGEEKCPLKDDLFEIKGKIQAADGVIFASPVYVNDVSGIMKNWIDRMAHVCHRPEFMGKYAYLLATTGGSPTGHTIRTLGTAASSWGFHIVGQAGFKTGARMPQAEIEARYQGKARTIARDLSMAIRNNRSFWPGFVSLMTFRIQQWHYQKRDRDSLDYRYWDSQGWTNPQREFYIVHRANRFKVTCARLTGSILARLMV